MSSGTYRRVDVVCPFFKFDDGRRRITCEGIIPRSSVALIYNCRCDYDMQFNEYCCKSYKYCEIYNLLMDKYLGEE